MVLLGFLVFLSMICWMSQSNASVDLGSASEPESEVFPDEISNLVDAHSSEVPSNERQTQRADDAAGNMLYDHHAVYGIICKDIRHINGLLEFFGDLPGRELLSLKAELELLFREFEERGSHEAGVSFMMVIHNRLLEFDPTFGLRGFGLADLQFQPDEPRITAQLPPEVPQNYLDVVLPPAFEPTSPEHMACWMIQRVTKRIENATLYGKIVRLRKNLCRRDLMVSVCKICRDDPTKRIHAWYFLQTMQDLSESESDSE